MNGRLIVVLLVLLAVGGVVFVALEGDINPLPQEEKIRIRAEVRDLETEGRWDDALAALSPLLRTHRPDVRDLLTAGRLEVGRGGQGPRAELYFRRAVEIAPEDPAAREALRAYLEGR